jgi:hypothetical protein
VEHVAARKLAKESFRALPQGSLQEKVESWRDLQSSNIEFTMKLLQSRSRRATMTIRNGLYSISTKLLDGAHGGQTGVSVLRDGKMLGGGSVLYHFGSYQCSEGKWKGEVTSQEHAPTIDIRPFAGYIASIGFAGTYTDEGAEFEATALVGKRSIRLKTVFRLLIAD